MRIILFFILLLSGLAHGQTHLRGQRYIQLEAGAYDEVLPSLQKGEMNYQFRVGLGSYSKQLRGGMFFVGYATKSTPLVDDEGNQIGVLIPVNQYTVGYQHELNLIENATKTFLVKLPFSGFLGYESLNNNKLKYGSYTLQKRSDILLGLAAGLEVEIHSFFIGYRQAYHLTSNYQKFGSYPYVGLKIHFFQ
ncbi:conjugal transfer protein TraO [Runella sp. MFBS21]|uniref:conjugal transfer protein TraO n=1 Tax=Runella sp. MFBS21 TaxID=3034018 RepID=UPI0023F98F81|nr:conjugal transfer protein TraO [Runella sp. MFBS21]MDF7821868.1 conjugal transfer protein TraO [Runella sp. MFBS21]